MQPLISSTPPDGSSLVTALIPVNAEGNLQRLLLDIEATFHDFGQKIPPYPHRRCVTIQKTSLAYINSERLYWAPTPWHPRRSSQRKLTKASLVFMYQLRARNTYVFI